MWIDYGAMTTPNPEFEFCDRLRKVRRTVAQCNQAAMAETLGVSQKVYAAWESGYNKPSDIVAVAQRIEALWPDQVTAAWMLDIAPAGVVVDRPFRGSAPRARGAGFGMSGSRAGKPAEPAEPAATKPAEPAATTTSSGGLDLYQWHPGLPLPCLVSIQEPFDLRLAILPVPPSLRSVGGLAVAA